MSFVAKLKSMPTTLAGLSCLFLFCGSLTIMGAVLPNQITREELRSSWDGFLLLAVGIVMVAFSIGVFRRIRMIRFLWPIYFVGILSQTLIARPDEVIEELVASIFGLLISSWYFFRKPTVVRYFQPVQRPQAVEATAPTSTLKVEP